MHPRVIRSLKTLLRAALIVVVAVYAIMFAMQRELLFPIHSANRMAWQTPEQEGLSGFAQSMITTEDGTRIALWYHQAKQGRPTILFFHGNGSILSWRARFFKVWAERGYGVAAISYRGYGISEGKPTENGLYQDAMAAVKYLGSRGVGEGEIVLVGQSLGSGVATELATRMHPRALVLVSPYTSIPDMVSVVYPWLPGARYLVFDRFDSLAKAGRVTAPVLVAHGDADALIPIALAQKLYARFGEPKSFVTIPGGTHFLMRQFVEAPALEAFLEATSSSIDRREKSRSLSSSD